MIVEWSARHGAPMSGDVQAWVALDNALHAVVLSGGAIYTVPRHLLRVVTDPEPPEAPATGMARIGRHLELVEARTPACPDLDQEYPFCDCALGECRALPNVRCHVVGCYRDANGGRLGKIPA